MSVLALGAAALTAGRVVFRTEAALEFAAKTIEQHAGKITAHDMVLVEVKTAQVGLVERVAAIGAVVGQKASVESVESVRESVDSLRRELAHKLDPLLTQLERIERKLDEDVRQERK